MVKSRSVAVAPEEALDYKFTRNTMRIEGVAAGLNQQESRKSPIESGTKSKG